MPPRFSIARCTHPLLRWFRLRCAFNAQPGDEGILLLATQQYALVWINGAYLGRTYERTHEHEWRYRSFDLGPHLRAGANTIAMLLHHWGPAEEDIPGVQPPAEARFASGGSCGDVTFNDLTRWRMQASPDYLPARRHNHLIGHEELRDFRLSPRGWRAADFPDQHWSAPTNAADEKIELAASLLPPLAEERIAPHRVLAWGALQTGAAWRAPTPKTGAGHWWRIEIELAQPAMWAFFYALRVGSRLMVDGVDSSRSFIPPMDWAEHLECIELPLTAGRHELVGFHPTSGHFRYGWVGAVPAGGELLSWSADAAGPFALCVTGEPDPDASLLTHRIIPHALPKLGPAGELACEVTDGDAALLVEFPVSITQLPRIRIAEATSGARLELLTSEKTSDLPGLLVRAAYRDQAILRDGAQDWQLSVQYKSARVILLLIRASGGHVRLSGVDAIYRHQNLDLRGDFQCDDQRVRGVWELCQHTLEHGAQDVMVDGPWREQLLYIGDNLVHNHACYHLAADHRIVEWQHTLYAQGQMPDGIFQPNQPCRTSPEHYRLLDQTILWPIQLWQHLLYTGRREFVHALLPAVRRLLDGFTRFATADDPRLRALTGWNWVDHPGVLGDGSLRSIRHDGVPTAINLLYVQALDAAAHIENDAGNQEAARRCRELGERVRDLLRHQHWCFTRRLYADCVIDGEPSAEASVHVNLLAILAGLGPDPAGILSRSWRQPEVTQILGPFFRIHLLEVLHRLGQHDELLAEIRTHWGAYLDAGLTTVPEYSSVNGLWSESLGHPWGVAPAIYVAKAIAGLEPLAPGWRRVRASPNLGSLRSVDCIIPVPGGTIRARWRRLPDGTIAGVVEAPAGCEVDLDPTVSGDPASLRLAGLLDS